MVNGLTIEQLLGIIVILAALDLAALFALLRRRKSGRKAENSSDVQPSAHTEDLQLIVKQRPSSLLSATSTRLLGQLRGFFSGKSVERETALKELEAALISGDIGVATTEKLLNHLRTELQDSEVSSASLEKSLRANMRAVFNGSDGQPLNLEQRPTILVLVGINGVGKTTTAGKLAERYSKAGKKVLLGACDTFRAAAVAQLQIWANRAGVEIVAGADSMKPATVAFNACKKALAENADLLILDTAGRLHNKKNLMDELSGVFKIINREIPGAPHEVLLVVDATSGQNALEQARAFKEICPLTGVVITKLDGSPRGGMLFAIRSELGIPVRYIGLGEGLNDLQPFDADWFLESLFGENPSSVGISIQS